MLTFLNPDVVFKIHKQYIAAGAMAIKTNTFGANSLLGLSFEEVEDLIRSGYEIALKATKSTDTLVFADIGYINSDKDEVILEYTKIAQTFINLGAKYFLFETLTEYEVLKPAIKHIKQCVSDAYIMVSFAVTEDGYTKKGHYYKDIITEASKSDLIDVVGLNCICGPSHIYNLLKNFDISHINFTTMPNSGYPATIGGRTVYQDNAEYFSDKMIDIYKLGVNILGGCCGTTPEHIKQLITKIRSYKDEPLEISKTGESNETIKKIQENKFKEKLLSGKKIIAVELDPPNSTNFEYIIEAAEKALYAGADIITLSDSPLARARADSIIISSKIKREVNVDVLPHLSCRDRNYIGIKSALLGANIEGINNILAITGDPVVETDRGTTKGVYNFNSFNLISYIKNLNTELFPASPFFIGAGPERKCSKL